MHKKKNLKKLLNLGVLDYTNLTPKVGELDMPYVTCNTVPRIDYIATYSQPSTYFRTPHTAVSFFEYDIFFDGLYGLWNGIKYGVEEILEFYEERFKDVKYFIAPDYSKCGDIPDEENRHAQFKSRVVSIWLTMHTNAVVIPLVSCANLHGMKYMLDGMEDTKVVAFSLKGPLGDPNQLEIFIESIKYTVDKLKKLESIVVYSASIDNDKVFEIFKYAIDAGIEIQTPENMLQIRNRLLGKGGDDDGSN